MQVRVIVVVCCEVTETESGWEHGVWRRPPLLASVMSAERPETS